MSNPIPPRSRELVEKRDGKFCFRCGTKVQGGHWHHRRSRSVRDGNEHSPANGIWLCPPCHEWVHANPFESRKYGWVVSRHETEIDEQPTYNFVLGWITLSHEGDWAAVVET